MRLLSSKALPENWWEARRKRIELEASLVTARICEVFNIVKCLTMNFQLQKSVSIIHSNCRHLFRKIALLQRFYRSEDYCRYLSLTCIRNILVEAKRVNL